MHPHDVYNNAGVLLMLFIKIWKSFILLNIKIIMFILCWYNGIYLVYR